MAECPGIWRLAETGDGALARLRLPGGGLTAQQLNTVAGIARSHGNGLIDLTHRANLQIRGLDIAESQTIADRLAEAGLLANEPRADRLRNITASPLAGLDADELLDVTDCVKALDEGLQATPELFALSPKFSFLLDGGGPNGVRHLAHDIGFFAETFGDRVVCRLSLAGRTTAYVVAASDVAEAAFALASLAVSHCGDAAPRIAAVLADRSPDEVVSHLHMSRSGLFERTEQPATATPDPEPIIGPVMQQNAKCVALGIGIPLARLEPEGAEQIAAWSETFGDGSLRLAPWQAIFLGNVPQDRVSALELAARDGGFFTEPRDLSVRVVACAGASGCLRTGADAKSDAMRILAALNGLAKDRKSPMTIHVSGCPRACAHPDAADLLLLGESDKVTYSAYANAQAQNPPENRRLAVQITGLEAADLVKHRMQGEP